MAWATTDELVACHETGTEHRLSVVTPFRPTPGAGSPLVLCLDGAWIAGTVRDATRIMSMAGEAPEAIVASLSFTDESMSDYLRSRARWFCPTQWVPPEVAGVKVADASQTGQALTYLGFIRDQVVPLLQERYQVSETWLIGHSFSALFGLRVLFTEPNLFNKYLLASPSLWWDNQAMFGIEDEYAAAHTDLAASVVMTSGSEEDRLVGFNMRENVVELADRLTARKYPSLQLAHAVLSNESHSSTIGAAISHGLRRLL